MLVSKNQHNEIINVLKHSAKELINLKKDEYTCIECGSKVILKHCHSKLSHFAHVKKSDCDFIHENEGIEHLSIKKAFYNILTQQGHKVEVEKSIVEGKLRADLLVDDTIALEIQCSNLSIERLAERTRLYKENGIQVYWMCGKNLWIDGLEKTSYLKKALNYFSKGDKRLHRFEVNLAKHEIVIRVRITEYADGRISSYKMRMPFDADWLGMMQDESFRIPAHPPIDLDNSMEISENVYKNNKLKVRSEETNRIIERFYEHGWYLWDLPEYFYYPGTVAPFSKDNDFYFKLLVIEAVDRWQFPLDLNDYSEFMEFVAQYVTKYKIDFLTLPNMNIDEVIWFYVSVELIHLTRCKILDGNVSTNYFKENLITPEKSTVEFREYIPM
ncbi:MAG: hypothetical protein LBN08_03275 [Lactobacillales bacterium]|jgi:competence protein CoiA|nr:hypothetical protein [Lactobacillales bacterium]